jgi:hypothetical protein
LLFSLFSDLASSDLASSELFFSSSDLSANCGFISFIVNFSEFSGPENHYIYVFIANNASSLDIVSLSFLTNAIIRCYPGPLNLTLAPFPSKAVFKIVQFDAVFSAFSIAFLCKAEKILLSSMVYIFYTSYVSCFNLFLVFSALLFLSSISIMFIFQYKLFTLKKNNYCCLMVKFRIKTRFCVYLFLDGSIICVVLNIFQIPSKP